MNNINDQFRHMKQLIIDMIPDMESKAESFRTMWKGIEIQKVLDRHEKFLAEMKEIALYPDPEDSPKADSFTHSTPDGKDQHEPGAKLDAGKVRAGLVLGGFSRALLEVSKVGTYGANLYTPYGWTKVENGEERYTDAMLRHFLRETAGEIKDPESSLPHAAHLAWNALARLDIMLRGKY